MAQTTNALNDVGYLHSDTFVNAYSNILIEIYEEPDDTRFDVIWNVDESFDITTLSVDLTQQV